MPPIVFLSPALKALLSLTPWLAGAAALGGIAGVQSGTNARLRSRLEQLESTRRNRGDSPEPSLSGASTRQAPTSDPRAEPRPHATTPDSAAAPAEEPSPKTSFLRRIMESNITLRKQHAE